MLAMTMQLLHGQTDVCGAPASTLQQTCSADSNIIVCRRLKDNMRMGLLVRSLLGNERKTVVRGDNNKTATFQTGASTRY